MKYYRERYTVTGIFENHPYEGIERLLNNLKEKGYTLGVASSEARFLWCILCWNIFIWILILM